MNLRNKTVLVVDNGLFVSWAERLSRDFGTVYYTTNARSQFRKINPSIIGQGIDGIEWTDDIFGKHFDKIDLFVFPDIGFGWLQVQLVKMGKRVWGARLGEELELYRDTCKKAMKQHALPVSEYEVVKGFDALRSYLKKHENVWVKVDKYRGTFETFKSTNYKEIEPELDRIEFEIGPYKHEIEFVVEEDLPDKIEVGLDYYCIDGTFPSQSLVGIEVKDLGYVAEFRKRSDLPPELLEFDNGMADLFKQYQYRGGYSFEARIGKDKIPFMIDFCARAASPQSELYIEFYENLAEILWFGAEVKCIVPEPVAKYGVEVIIKANNADENWQLVDFPEESRRFIKLYNVTKIRDRYCVIPQVTGMNEIGVIVGWGETLDEAFKQVEKVNETISGFKVKVDLSAIDTAEAEMRKSEEFGIKLFS